MVKFIKFAEYETSAASNVACTVTGYGVIAMPTVTVTVFHFKNLDQLNEMDVW